MRPDDGGFESGGVGTPWGYSTFPSGFSQEQVHSGLYSMRLVADGFLGGSVYQWIPTTPGELLSIAGWFYADPGAVGADKALQLHVDSDPGDGSNLIEIESFRPSDVGGLTWVPHLYPGVIAGATQAFLYWGNAAPGVFVGELSWYLDDLMIAGGDDVAKRSRWLAHQRLVQVLKGINGVAGGYHLDLGNRVFTKYIRPVGSTHPALPYLCVPLVNTAPRVDHDNTHLKHTWTLPIMAFVAEPNVGAYDSDAIAALYHLGEDVYRAVMQDPTLNNTVAPISFVSGGVEEGGISPFDGLPYADAVIPIDLSIYLGLDVLGP